MMMMIPTMFLGKREDATGEPEWKYWPSLLTVNMATMMIVVSVMMMMLMIMLKTMVIMRMMIMITRMRIGAGAEEPAGGQPR